MIHIIFFYLMSLHFHSWEQGDYRIQSAPAPTHRVSFRIRNAGVDVEGTINVVKTEFNFDPQNPGNSMITASADPSTIVTGIGIRDNHLRRKDYFDVDHFSKIYLRSLQFRKAGKNKFIGDFQLTIKNITKVVKITFERKRSDFSIRYVGTFQINRIEFDIGEQSALLENEVSIDFDLESSQQN